MERMRTLLVVGLSLFVAHGGQRTLLYRSPADAVGPPVHARFSPHREHRFDAGARSIWLLAADGSSRRVDIASGRRSDDDYGHNTRRALPLLGKTIAVDPGHNGANWAHPAEINRLVDAGGFRKACDTTGTSTGDGLSEAWYDFDVAVRLTRILRSQGARVVLTRRSNDGVGPCIDERAAIGNRAHADAAISIHADGGPPGGRGFEVIYKPNAPASHRLALAVRRAFALITGEPYSTYVGRDGLDVRTDLGGLNLSTVPKVLIETANMRNAADAQRIESAAYRRREAVALARALDSFLG